MLKIYKIINEIIQDQIEKLFFIINFIYIIGTIYMKNIFQLKMKLSAEQKILEKNFLKILKMFLEFF